MQISNLVQTTISYYYEQRSMVQSNTILNKNSDAIIDFLFHWILKHYKMYFVYILYNK